MAVPCEMLLHPELLTNEQLLHVIQERHLRVPNMESIPRHELLEIFHNYCVPYGQRKYRDTGRGKLLNKNRQTSPEPKSIQNNVNSNIQCRKLTHPWPNERLKPLPDQLCGRVKLLKLEMNSACNNILECSKRKLCVDSPSPTLDGPPAKKERKPITWP